MPSSLKLKQRYLKEQFNPGPIGVFVNPFYLARKGLFREIRDLGHFINGHVLDVGCGLKPYERLFKATAYVGLELDTPENRARKRADAFYDGGRFPFDDASVDCIVCNQVLEHVFTPHAFLSEINRVLRCDGFMLLTVPFVWDEHEKPWDYARYSSYGIKSILNENGFEVRESRKTLADVRVIFQLINAYLYKKTMTRNAYVNLITTALLLSPASILGELFSRILPGNEDLYLDNVVLAQKVEKA